MARKSRTFVPSATLLEDRTALSAFTPGGQAILTTRALNNASHAVENAFVRYVRNHETAAQLSNELMVAVQAIPYHNRDGLAATLRTEVATMTRNVNAGAAHPYATSMRATLSDVQQFVTREVANHLVVVR